MTGTITAITAPKQQKRQTDSLEPVNDEDRRGAALQHQVGEEPRHQEERRHSPRVDEVEYQCQQDGLVVVGRPDELKPVDREKYGSEPWRTMPSSIANPLRPSNPWYRCVCVPLVELMLTFQ